MRMSVLKTFGIGSRFLPTQRFSSVLQDSTACFSSTFLVKLNNRQQRNVHVLFPAGLLKCHNDCVAKKSGMRNSIFQRSYSSVGSEDTKGIQVYEGRIKGLMKRVKIFSLATSVFGLAGQPYLWYSMQDVSLLFAAPLFTVVNFFVFANPLMIHYLAKRYVTELHFHPATETYTATVLSLFAMKNTFTFTADDVEVPEIPGMFSMLTAKGRPIFVDHRDFTSIEIYKKMMGFDKPLDLTYVADSEEKR